MKKVVILLLMLAHLIQCTDVVYQDSALTYIYNGGRFGDCIVNYVKSKLIAFKRGIPFYFSPFWKSELLKAYHAETIFTPEIEKKFSKRIIVNAESIIPTIKEPALFLTKFKTKLNLNHVDDLYKNIVLDECFDNEIKLMLQPTVPIKILNLPEDCITVAVHIRKGSGTDGPLFSMQYFNGHEDLVQYTEYTICPRTKSDQGDQKLIVEVPSDIMRTHEDEPRAEKNINRGNTRNYFDKNKLWLKKFPPEQFYVDQIKKLSELLEHKPLYVYIFTDHKNPGALVKKIQREVNISNIIFASQVSHNHNATMIDDYYNMAQFDCLIRPDSSFSYAAQLLGRHAIIIYPEGARWIGRKLIMNKVAIVYNENNTLKK